MKKIILAGALAIVVASPALAATRHHHRAATADQSYAYVPAIGAPVVDNGQYLGADPDVFIREGLIREGSPADYSN